MHLPIFQVDAFTDKVFGGNPAAVCPLEHWLPDDVMQKIAIENSVAETAFFIPLKDGFEIRCFTPDIEMDLCGHATLATAHVIARHLNYSLPSIKFQSKSGELMVTVENELLTLNFPSRKPEPSDIPQIIDEVDFVSRYFTPQASIFEDPVTGSAHCSLIPFWSEKLGRESMLALQVSPRVGKLFCKYLGERVLISGEAVTYLAGRITI